MELKKYTDEEFARYNGAVGILGKAIGICSFLYYNMATNEDDKAAVLSLLHKYGYMRSRLDIESTDIIQYAFDEIQPLIAGDTPALNLNYIVESNHVRVAV
ncbi:MAG: hypothetical protein LBU42_05645 [Prevotellaceae bacterium]|jgi:hypothetical protein|nr:hypothetical protein [Prevotellaceae bacterium]